MKYIKAITAGFIIGLCMENYYRINSIYIGAFLFGVGLVTICSCDLPLFTGRIGKQTDLDVLLFLLFNFVGVTIAFLWFYGTEEWLFTNAIGCGCLMQIAVTMYKKKMPYITVMCVAAFLLSGHKHCIAYMYSGMYAFGLEYLKNVIIIVLGNTIGAKLMYFGGVNNDEQ